MNQRLAVPADGTATPITGRWHGNPHHGRATGRIAGRRPRLPRLPRPAAFYLLASIVLFFLAGSSAPTPLYDYYAGVWGFSPIMITVVFGIYALAVLASLLVAGSLSDHVGRRPVLLVALAAQAVTMALFSTAGGVDELIAARVLQGLSTGAALGAIGAGMLDLNRRRGTTANSVAPLLGTAAGAIGSGVLVQYLPAPTHLVYLALLTIFVAQGVGVALMDEPATPRPGALASLRLRLAVPDDVRRPLLLAIPALVAIWSLPGFYGSLGPSLVGRLVGSSSYVLGGLALATLAASAVLAVVLARAAAPRRLMRLASVLLLGGVGLTLLAVDARSGVWFFAGTVLAGLGFGAGFQAALGSVLPLAAEHERAGVLSVVYTVSYLSMGLPAVIAGVLVVDGGGVLATAREYSVAVMVLAGLALLGVVRRPAIA